MERMKTRLFIYIHIVFLFLIHITVFEIVRAEPMTVQMYICMYKTDCVSCLIQSDNSLLFTSFYYLDVVLSINIITPLLFFSLKSNKSVTKKLINKKKKMMTKGKKSSKQIIDI